MSAQPYASLSSLAASEADLAVLKAAVGSENDPSLLFGWHDAAVNTLHAVAMGLRVAIVPVRDPHFNIIPLTTAAFKDTIIAYIAQNALPGVAVIAGTTSALGLAALMALHQYGQATHWLSFLTRPGPLPYLRPPQQAWVHLLTSLRHAQAPQGCAAMLCECFLAQSILASSTSYPLRGRPGALATPG